MHKLTSKLSNLILLLLIIIIFISLILTNFNNYLLENLSEYEIKINNTEISREEFIQRYNLECFYNDKNFKNDIITNPKNPKYISEIYNITLSNIIYESLLQQYVHQLHFNIDYSHVKNYIYKQTIFRQNQKFNKEKYYEYLKKLQISSNEYIKKVMTYLEIKEFIKTLTNTDFILNNEKNNILKLFEQGRIVNKSYVNLNNLKLIEHISNKELKRYYINHKHQFLSPKKFKISYFLINKNNVFVPCIKKFYFKNKDNTFQHELFLQHKKSKKQNDNIIKKLLTTHTNTSQFKNIIQKNNICIHHTPWLTQTLYKHEKLPKKLLKYIINNNILFHNNKNTIKNYPTIIHMNNNNAYVLWIQKYEKATIENFSKKIRKKIINILKNEHSKKIRYQIVQKIVYQLNHGDTNLFSQLKLKFSNSEYYSRFNTNTLTNKIFSLPIPKKGQKIYFIFHDQKKLFLYQFSNIFYFKLTKKQKKMIASYISQSHSEIILNAILENLYKTAHISYKGYIN
ncbi:peptidyl-prolyl cis-trans isomerase D [Buchnera aphidicola str. Bp (Baizongia pistaciae)]|uniref:Putative chaperone PpiD n=1 Tax=Buchnera aphidicola subsp. Baizongia pistaciae (strain Bp) TaxID=224915 RepID=PPID_BUCBP|nr:SurA N-terminal domain-containing protein [Buchnera aphidicola]Q89A98.1 PUTATIVE PSEUDOGENE: RecName: Full=Putative chaperone PpiD [Buchnera aphidicola str. Bp (Baizongia pistaciae)]AAO27132.1 peptidyl-prolyl cis-trans isomerase D [Buchnera aphidicola str. Bp (Baizongia pistaciae)]